MSDYRDEVRDTLPKKYHPYIPDEIPDQYQDHGERVTYAATWALTSYLIEEKGWGPGKAFRYIKSAVYQGYAAAKGQVDELDFDIDIN